MLLLLVRELLCRRLFLRTHVKDYPQAKRDLANQRS